MKDKLEKGDTVIVSTVLSGEREYVVKEVIGKKAITDFRTFNTKIYPGGCVYQIGKGALTTTNGYWLKDSQKDL